MKNILIVGSGALGTLFAGRLAEIGASVTVLGTWRNAIDALNRQGAGLVQPDGSVMRFPVQATKDPAECKNIDLAISLVKAWQTGRAAQQLAQCLPENGVVLTLQNGLGNRETLSASHPRLFQNPSNSRATLLRSRNQGGAPTFLSA